MRTFTRFLIVAFLALILMTGQGFTELSSWAASCCSKPMVQKAMSCCHGGVCEKHKAVNPVTLKQKSEACQCAPASGDMQYEKASQLMDGKLQLVASSHPNPVLSLQVADTDAPIWLHRLFYPDKSRLFLKKNSWLL
jgi:hypothetical protein